MLVVFYNSGQLGNRLFYFSHFIAFAELKKTKVICLFFNEYSKHFKGTADNICGIYPKPFFSMGSAFARKIISYVLWNLFSFAKKYKINNRFLSTYKPPHDGKMESINYGAKDFANDPNYKEALFTFYDGNYPWYDTTDLSEFEQPIEAFFQTHKEVNEKVNTFIENERKEIDLLVGIHIRRGDYKDFAGGKYYFSDVKYLKLMNEFQANFPGKNIKFIICSNEKISPNNYPFLKCTFSKGSFMEDLIILSKCDYLIGPPSTFSDWASFSGQVPIFHIYSKETELRLDEFATCHGRPFVAGEQKEDTEVKLNKKIKRNIKAGKARRKAAIRQYI